ncbi:MAG: hypothetical protein QNJ54_22430 [Prochloraceae cyanobacterium]|nr:hypothetical protein [Prochloraceae cyanobacterium]
MKNSSRRRSTKNCLTLSLFLIVLTSGSIIGCQNNEKHQSEVTNNPTLTSSDSSLTDLEKTVSNFKVSTDKFVQNIEKAQKSQNSDIKNSLKSDDLAKKLAELNKQIDLFEKQGLKNIVDKQQEEIKKILEDIKKTLKEVSEKIINPLKDGLGCEDSGTKCDNIEKVQRNLDFFKTQNIPDKYYGALGPTTIKEIRKFLSKKIDDLEKNVQLIREKINPPPLSTKTPNNQGSNSEINKLAEQIKLLKQEIQQIKQETQQIKQESQQIKQESQQIKQKNQQIKQESQQIRIISLVAILLSIIALLPHIFNRLKIFKNKKKITKTSTKLPDNLSTQSVSPGQVKENYWDINEIYHQILPELNEQLLSIVDREIDSELKPIKYELKEIKNSLRLKNPSHQVYTDEKSNQREQKHYFQDQSKYSREHTVEPSLQTFTSSNLRWVQTYNRDPRSLSRNAIEVSETQKSISDRSLGISKIVTLENKNRGAYVILTEGNIDYLVPGPNFRITDNNYKTVQALFECRGYKKGYSENFQLIQPATVYPLSGNQHWQLQERGILQF